MNVNIKTLYFIIKEGRVILCESNLKDFINAFPQELKDIRAYDYYYRRFKQSNYFQFEFNREYYFQKIEFPSGVDEK